MPKNHRVPRSSSVLGRRQKLGMDIPQAHHVMMENVAVACGYTSKTEVVRNAVIFLNDAVELAKSGQQFGVVSKDGKITRLYGTVFSLISSTVKSEPPIRQ